MILYIRSVFRVFGKKQGIKAIRSFCKVPSAWLGGIYNFRRVPSVWLRGIRNFRRVPSAWLSAYRNFSKVPSVWLGGIRNFRKDLDARQKKVCFKDYHQYLALKKGLFQAFE